MAQLASWEKHTKGIGSKLLQKFGFKGRLGANEDGVATSIEVTVRPAGLGLGFGEESKVIKDKKRPARSDAEREEMEGWKKSKYQKMAPSSTISSTNKELHIADSMLDLLLADSSSGRREVIIDMRGAEAVVLASLSDMSGAADGEKDSENNLLGRELLFNLDLLEAMQLRSLSKQREDEQVRLRSLHDLELKSTKILQSMEREREVEAALRTLLCALEVISEATERSAAGSPLDLPPLLQQLGEG
ncbi:hypothetical protein EON64_11370, partial [archaeon]